MADREQNVKNLATMILEQRIFAAKIRRDAGAGISQQDMMSLADAIAGWADQLDAWETAAWEQSADVIPFPKPRVISNGADAARDARGFEQVPNGH